MNWSGMMKSVGLCSSFSDPTADTETNALHAELLEGIDIGAEVQLRGQDAMATSVARQEGNLAPFQFAQNKGIGRLAKRRLYAFFLYVGESGHGIKPAAADNADLRFSQIVLPMRARLRPAPSLLANNSV